MSSSRIAGVLFDMDGTLFDSADSVPVAYAAAIRDLGGPICTPEEIVAHYWAGPAAALMAAILGRDTTEADVDRFHRHLADQLHGIRPYPGVEEALGGLVEAGLKIGVFTGATRTAAEMQLRHMGLLDLFHCLVGSNEIAAVKPAPDGIQAGCDRLGIEPRRAAYVGDALNDLRCARAAGSMAVAAGWGHLFEPSAEADLVLSAPSELLRLSTWDGRGG